MAQLDSASDSDSEGRGFESRRAHQAKPTSRFWLVGFFLFLSVLYTLYITGNCYRQLYLFCTHYALFYIGFRYDICSDFLKKTGESASFNLSAGEISVFREFLKLLYIFINDQHHLDVINTVLPCILLSIDRNSTRILS